jgi:hypothetical protein
MSTATDREQLLRALAGKDAQAGVQVVERTRRAVRVAIAARHEAHARRRRNLGVALAVCLGTLMLLAPALWSSMDDLAGGEHFADIPTQLALLLMVLFPALIAALVAGWRTQGFRDPRSY